MLQKLSANGLSFMSVVSSHQDAMLFNACLGKNTEEDILYHHRLKSLIITSKIGSFGTAPEEHRLYDPVSNSYLDISVYKTGVHDTVRHIRSISEWHNGKIIHHDMPPADVSDIGPVISRFEQHVATSYYNGKTDWIPAIERHTVPYKNFIVSNIKAIVNKEHMNDHYKAIVEAKQKEQDESKHGIVFPGTLRLFLEEKQALTKFPMSAAVATLHTLFKDFIGLSFELVDKTTTERIKNSLRDLNSITENEKVIISAELNEHLLSRTIWKGCDYKPKEFLSDIKGIVMDAVRHAHSDLPPDAITKHNALFNRYISALDTYHQVKNADMYTADKSDLVRHLALNNIMFTESDSRMNDYNTAYNNFINSGMYDYLMS